MQRSAKHAAEQARAVRANEVHARQDTFMELAEMVRRQLGRHCDNFVRIFERLLREAVDCDPNGIIRDAVEGSAHGLLYRRMLEYQEARGPATEDRR